MALARLNCGRFNEEAPEHSVSRSEGGEAAASSTVGGGSALTKTASVVGTSQARFLGEYNPLLNLPLKRRTMNTDVVLLPELTDALEELHKSQVMHANHKKKDSVKAYLDEVAKFSQATRFRK